MFDELIVVQEDKRLVKMSRIASRRLVKRLGLLLLVLSGLMSLGIYGTQASAQPADRRALAKVEALRRILPTAQQDGSVRVIVELDTAFYPEGEIRSSSAVHSQRYEIGRIQDVVSTRLSSFNASIIRNFKFIPLMTVRVDAAGLEDLAANPFVISIQEDEAVPPVLSDSVPLIGADTAWASGYAGAGQTIAILDTGVDSDHEFLTGKVVAEACFSTTSAGSSSTTLCPNGLETQTGTGAGADCDSAIPGCDHGTHVSGIAAGQGSSFSGVARDADLIAVQVFSRFDSVAFCGAGNTPCILSWTSDQIAGLEWVYDQSSSITIASVNMSLGGGQAYSNCDGDSRKLAIDNLASVGIATVIASGNNGFRDSLSYPACISSAVSVGSTDKSDVISSFSNVASFLSLVAPGSSINSSIPGDLYAFFSGTSMAAPHTAGAWAVLKSKNPAASVSDVLAAFTSTGVLIDDTRTSGVEVDLPRIQVDLAVAALADPAPTATPTSALTPTPTLTATISPTPSATSTPTPSSTPTATFTPLPTNTPTATVTASFTPTPTPTQVFDDVPPGHWAYDYIGALFEAGYVAGCSLTPPLYCPDNILIRAESAVFVLRGAYGGTADLPYPPPSTPSFSDVDPAYWGYAWIESMWTDGFTAGCGTDPLIYCPLSNHTRAEGSVFFLIVKNGVGYSPPPPVGIFDDVALAAWYAGWVEAAYNEGILLECGTAPLRFCPDDSLDRSWTAYMMVQAKGGLPLPSPTPTPTSSPTPTPTPTSTPTP